ncbi:dihydroxy-acid dehydratase, partial [Rhizobium ruizarguesonis]
EMVKAGEMTQAEFLEAEASMSRSSGTCNTMGTASTMASMSEALGMALSGNAAIPGVDSCDLSLRGHSAFFFIVSIL